MSSTSDITGFNTYLDSFHRRGDYPDKFLELISTMSVDRETLGLDAAKSCLAIATGIGRFELEFIRHHSPSLQTLTAVEPDAASAAELRLNLQRLLPHVNAVVHETTMQEFIAGNCRSSATQMPQPFDVVLLFHFPYYVNEEQDRRTLLHSLFADLVRPAGGAVVLAYESRCQRGRDMFALADAMNPTNRLPSCENWQHELTAAGFREDRRNYECRYSLDFNEPNDDLLAFCCDVAQTKISMEEFRAAVRRAWPDGKTDNCVARVCVFRKP